MAQATAAVEAEHPYIRQWDIRADAYANDDGTCSVLLSDQSFPGRGRHFLVTIHPDGPVDVLPGR